MISFERSQYIPGKPLLVIWFSFILLWDVRHDGCRVPRRVVPRRRVGKPMT